jgi:hypothetical protein
MEKADVTGFEVLLWHLPGRTEEYHEEPQSELSVSRSRFKPGTS